MLNLYHVELFLRLTCELVLERSGWFPGDAVKVVHPGHCRYMAESIPI